MASLACPKTGPFTRLAPDGDPVAVIEASAARLATRARYEARCPRRGGVRRARAGARLPAATRRATSGSNTKGDARISGAVKAGKAYVGGDREMLAEAPRAAVNAPAAKIGEMNGGKASRQPRRRTGRWVREDDSHFWSDQGGNRATWRADTAAAPPVVDAERLGVSPGWRVRASGW
ncbi:hypothetical protein GCM10022254_23460 [Actinomadura meridiana]|uniref:Uncharacterized protein n=1 Tax=Actinomadura meridiana TaxID=559626 RepID=A0ABP8BY45_9ACTN